MPRSKHYIYKIELDEDCPYKIIPLSELPPENIFPQSLDDDITPNYELFKGFNLLPHNAYPALIYSDKEYTCTRHVYAICTIINGVLDKTIIEI